MDVRSGLSLREGWLGTNSVCNNSSGDLITPWLSVHKKSVYWFNELQMSAVCAGMCFMPRLQKWIRLFSVLHACMLSHVWLSVTPSPGFSAHGIFQARILECVAISSSRGSSQPRDQTQVSSTAGGLFTIWVTREVRPQEGVEPLITCILQPLTKDYRLFSFNPIALI